MRFTRLAKRRDQPTPTVYVLSAMAIFIVQAIVLRAMGRPSICTCGYIQFWYGDLNGAGLSQHLTDWYTFTHITHGFGFYFLLRWLAPRASFGLRLTLMLGLETSWEIMENSPFIIDRYRQSALAQGYDGDSVANSLSDSVSTLLGFVLACLLPARLSLALVLASEVFLAFAIRDNLSLNIIQLVHPTQAVSAWQAGR